MKILEPRYEILSQGEGMDGVYKQIELCGRTCYASSMKIDKDSAKPFVERMVGSNHLAMCEHGTIYLHVAYEEGFFVPESLLVKHYRENKYSKVMQIGSDYYITTNYRVIVENNWFEDLDYICEPTEWHEKRITVRFTTQIAVSREANRHRVDSVAEQSTRYCNYSKDKFGGEIAINKPKWVSEDDAVNPSSFDGGTFVDLSKNIGSYEHWSPVEKWWFANRVTYHIDAERNPTGSIVGRTSNNEERSYHKMEVSNNYSTAKLWGTSDKKVSKSSEKNKWKLTDSLKEKIVELAKKDAQDNVYMGNAFMNLRKMEVSKVAPNRAALIGKFNQSMNSGNMSAMKEVEKADKKWLCILFGIPYEAEFQGEGTGSAAHVYNECGEEVLTYTEGVGWQEKETKAESQVHSALKSTYYEAFCDARKALNSEQRTGGMNENIMSQDNFDMKA